MDEARYATVVWPISATLHGRIEASQDSCTDDGRMTRTVVRSTWKFITLTDQTIHIVGDDAIVRHIFTGETERDGKTNPITIGVLMVWHKQNGDWKLLARQAVRLEERRTNGATTP
jgi:ketosteroid isomerase-like protein